MLSTETLLHIWLSTEYYGFRPSSTAVDTGDTRGLMFIVFQYNSDLSNAIEFENQKSVFLLTVYTIYKEKHIPAVEKQVSFSKLIHLFFYFQCPC